MSTEPDSLRRSKRNKFHLDVATMHLANPERRRPHQGRLTPSPDVVATCRTSSLSPAGNASPIPSSEQPIGRRGLEGTNLCVKCPARFETRPGLANHFKLHFGEKRKFACELCDFSSTTPKSLRLHQKVHDRFGIGPAAAVTVTTTLPDSQENQQSHIEDLHCDMLAVESAFGLNSSPPQLSPPIGYSSCPSRSHTELALSSAEPSQSSRRTAERNSPITPPPDLVRVNAALNPNQESHKEQHRKCSECPYIAKTTSRLAIHSRGHQKRSGFLCPFCTFKSGSAGFLKRHVKMHGCSTFTWPPTYVGLSMPWKSVLDRNSSSRRSRSIMNLLFLRCASEHAASPTRWPCPILGCNFSAAVISQHVVHHAQFHIS
ncbi:ZnF_C2H2, partial [Parelaphostrongylus tenuis]